VASARFAALASQVQARQCGEMSPGSILAANIAKAAAPIVDLIYPPRCLLCGGSIAGQQGLCGPCWSQLQIPGEPGCAACQRPFGGSSVAEGALCAPCLAKPPRHDGIAAGTLYNPASRKLVLAFKHGRRIAIAPMLARLIAARLPLMEGEWLIIPVPLHRWRLWHRGYNQAALLAAELARLTRASLCVDALVRTKATPSLGGLGKKMRARALSGAITLGPGKAALVKGARIVLVDDVLTSGATSDACVKTLKKAGAEKVVIACFARVMDEALGMSPKDITPGTDPDPGAT